MQEVLIKKLHQYIADNNPDLLVTLQPDGTLSNYLKERVASIDLLLNEFLAAGTPAYIIEESCLDVLTKELRPSKFNYLTSIIQDEFESDYNRLHESGLLTYEVMNLIESCTPVFEAFGFTEENEANRYLSYAIVGAIKEYFDKKQ